MSINQNNALSNVCLQANSTRGFSHNFHDVLCHRFSIILLEKGLMSSIVKPKINISSAPVFQSIVHRYRCREREVRFNPQQMDIPWNVKKHELRKMKECRTTSHILWLNTTYKCYKIKALAMIWLLLGNRIWVTYEQLSISFSRYLITSGVGLPMLSQCILRSDDKSTPSKFVFFEVSTRANQKSVKTVSFFGTTYVSKQLSDDQKN